MKITPLEAIVDIIYVLEKVPGAKVQRKLLGVPYGKYGFTGVPLKEAVSKAKDMGLVKAGDDGLGLGYEWVAFTDFTNHLIRYCSWEEFLAAIVVIGVTYDLQASTGRNRVLRSAVGIVFKKYCTSEDAIDCKTAISRANAAGGLRIGNDGRPGTDWVQYVLTPSEEPQSPSARSASSPVSAYDVDRVSKSKAVKANAGSMNGTIYGNVYHANKSDGYSTHSRPNNYIGNDSSSTDSCDDSDSSGIGNGCDDNDSSGVGNGCDDNDSSGVDGCNILSFAKNPVTWKVCQNKVAIALPTAVKSRMALHKESWKNRRLGSWLEKLYNGEGKWLPLGVFDGHVASIPDMDSSTNISPETKKLLLNCVWYYPPPFADGAASTLHLGIDTIGRPVAVKKFKRDAAKDIQDRVKSLGRSECSFSEAFRLASQSEAHAGLVKYISHSHWTSEVEGEPLPNYALVTELMNMSLDELIKLWRTEKCTSTQLAEVIPQIARQLIATVRDFHTVCDTNGKTMTHNDLNTMNIMIDCRGIVRIIDVGISYYQSEEVNAEVKAPVTYTVAPANLATCFRAPEVVSALATRDRDTNAGFSQGSDVYSIGCVLQELGQLRHAKAAGFILSPLADSQSPLMKYHQDNDDVPVTHHQWCLSDLVRRCKSTKSSQRPSCDQLMTHPLLWSSEKCISFLSHFVNPFLHVNDGTTKKFEELSKLFKNREVGGKHHTTDFVALLKQSEWDAAALSTQAEVKNGDDAGYVLPSSHFLKTNRNKYESWLSEFKTNSKLSTFYKTIPPKFNTYDANPKVLDLLRLINNHSKSHHKPHYDEVDILEAFPYLVIDAYDIATSFEDSWGVGVHEFIKPKYDDKKGAQ